jgi:hypothetical protein
MLWANACDRRLAGGEGLCFCSAEDRIKTPILEAPELLNRSGFCSQASGNHSEQLKPLLLAAKEKRVPVFCQGWLQA